MFVRSSFLRISTGLVLGCAVALTGCASAGSSSSKSSPKTAEKIEKQVSGKTSARTLQQRPSEINRELPNFKVTRSGEVYLLRGLANVFSRGMDTMGEKLVRKGVDARVYNHSSWKSLADNIIARSKVKKVSYPIAILGHSLGANASMQMARYLGEKGIKVSYVVAYDPTVPTFVGKNIRHAINYYLPNEEKQKPTKKLVGFKGKLENVNVSKMSGVTHMNVEKNGKLQSRAISKIMSITKPKKTAKKKRSTSRIKKRIRRRG